jgi:thymidylate synthase ThyX
MKQSVKKVEIRNPYEKIEYCGRICYKSEPKGDAVGFIKKRIASGHESILEHVYITVYVDTDTPIFLDDKFLTIGTRSVSGNIRSFRNYCKRRKDYAMAQYLLSILRGSAYNHFFEDIPCKDKTASGGIVLMKQETYHCVTNRGISHELVRHRQMSFSQESTRYIKYDEIEYIDPLTDHPALGRALKACSKAYKELIRGGIPPQIARAVLPNDLKTEIIITGTPQMWDYVINLRSQPDCHPQMQELMKEIKTCRS